ncbi:GntR family transcriptional regulator, transcriptional repressor for pyruvate dehydrogenase complex [Marmoricola sp. URHA0025 HA25]
MSERDRAVAGETPDQQAVLPAPVGLTTAISVALLGSIEPVARAEHIAGRLAEAIQVGLILEGEKLPSELQLADELGAAPVTLREALAILRERGLVETRRGRGGGTFVRGSGAPSGAGLSREELLRQRLVAFSVHDLRELGDLRRAISSMSAALAADRALPHEVSGLRRRLDRLAQADTTSQRRRADMVLIVEVAAAAQSAVLAREELAVLSRVGDLMWWDRADDDHAAVVVERHRMIDAIAHGDGRLAAASAERVVVADTARLIARRLELYR